MRQKNLVLVVDDEYSNRLLLEELLFDYDVVTASGGVEMWKCMEKSVPDIILMDVMMPDEDGFSLAQKIGADPWVGFAAAALLVLGYAWDSADGQVARLSGGGSIAGEWLDHFVDAIKISTLHLAVAIGLYRFAPEIPRVWLLVPLAFSAVATTTFFGMLLNDLLKGARGVPSTHARGGGTFTRSMMLLPTDFGVVCLVFVLWGAPILFLWAYGTLFVFAALFLVAAAAKWFREMQRVG